MHEPSLVADKDELPACCGMRRHAGVNSVAAERLAAGLFDILHRLIVRYDGHSVALQPRLGRGAHSEQGRPRMACLAILAILGLTANVKLQQSYVVVRAYAGGHCAVAGGTAT